MRRTPAYKTVARVRVWPFAILSLVRCAWGVPLALENGMELAIFRVLEYGSQQCRLPRARDAVGALAEHYPSAKREHALRAYNSGDGAIALPAAAFFAVICRVAAGGQRGRRGHGRALRVRKYSARD